MKFAKLGFTTKEGLSLANFQDGWSMEYGEGGSYNVNVTLNGKVLANITEEGNGGPVMVDYLTNDKEERKALDDAVLACLKRTDKDYGPDSKYDFYKDVKTASDTEYAVLIGKLTEVYEKHKTAKKYFKKGYKMIAIITNQFDYSMTASPREDKDEILAHLKNKNILKENSVVEFLTENDLKTIQF